jgi:hypothetical protein
MHAGGAAAEVSGNIKSSTIVELPINEAQARPLMMLTVMEALRPHPQA